MNNPGPSKSILKTGFELVFEKEVNTFQLRMYLRTLRNLAIPPPLHGTLLPNAHPISLNQEMFPHMLIPLRFRHRFHPHLLVFPANPTAQQLLMFGLSGRNM